MVDTADEAALLAGLRRVLEDPERSRARAQRALRLVEERHDTTRVGEQFAAILAAVRPPAAQLVGVR